MQQIEPQTTTDRNVLELRDVTDDSRLVVSHLRERSNRTATIVEDTSVRLSMLALALFEGGTVNVGDLTAEERAWLESEDDRLDLEVA